MRTVFFAAAIASLAAASCIDAPDTETGGELRFDAAPPAITIDAGCADPNADAGSGVAWSDLYRDYFGPSGKASCAGTGVCHGAADQLGAQSSNYVCAGTVTGCYQGITNPAAGLVTVGDTTSDPTLSSLYLTLRKECGLGGIMPKQPASFYFTPADMKRIASWIKAGAPND